MRVDRMFPTTWRGRQTLRLVALAQLVLSVLLLPVAALWYGLHEVPEYVHDGMRPAVLTLWFARSGPSLSRSVFW